MFLKAILKKIILNFGLNFSKRQESPSFFRRYGWFILKKTGKQESQSNNFLIQAGCV